MSKFYANIWKMSAIKFLSNLHFFAGILIPFFVQWGRLNFTQIMLLQSWGVIWAFILEIPTGTIADYFGRKTSIILSYLFGIIAFLVYVIKPSFYVFLFAEFIFAISFTLQSGAYEALIYDSLKRSKKLKLSKKVFGRIESMGLFGILIAAPIGSLIASYFGVRAPVLLFTIPLSLAFLIALTLREPLTRKKTESTRYITILKNGIKFFINHKVLKILALDMIFVGSIAYFILWLYQPLLTQVGLNITYFGIVHSLIVISEIIVMNSYDKFEKFLGSKRGFIFLSSFITGTMFIICGLVSYLPALILAIILSAAFGLSRKPLFISYMNKYIPSSKRATVLSAISMCEKFFIAVINPIVGKMVDWSLNYTLVLLGFTVIVFSLISRVEEKYLLK